MSYVIVAFLASAVTMIGLAIVLPSPHELHVRLCHVPACDGRSRVDELEIPDEIPDVRLIPKSTASQDWLS